MNGREGTRAIQISLGERQAEKSVTRRMKLGSIEALGTEKPFLRK